MPELDEALVTTIGSDAATSYVDLDYAEQYFAGRASGKVWRDEADTARKVGALLEAVERLDALNFIGMRWQLNQALEWPRLTGTSRNQSIFTPRIGINLGLYDLRGRYFNVTDIPTPIKKAQCEIAQLILIEATSEQFDDGGISSFALGDLRVTREAKKTTSTRIPDTAMRLLDGLLMNGSRLVKC